MSDRAQPAIERADYVNQTIAAQTVAEGEKRLTKYERSPPSEDLLDHPALSLKIISDF
jgi:hypothetical protein